MEVSSSSALLLLQTSAAGRRCPVQIRESTVANAQAALTSSCETRLIYGSARSPAKTTTRSTDIVHWSKSQR